jgi:tRNA pseudouridine65 synthase
MTAFSHLLSENDGFRLYEQPLQILYEDDYLIAVYKPSGLLMHRTPISQDKVFLLQWVRQQLGQRIYTVHRLDRGTSGVVLFGKTPEMASLLGQALGQQEMQKTYLAVVRGWLLDSETIDYPLQDSESGQVHAVEAKTHYKCLQKSELDHPIGIRYPTARFSLAEITPFTGRRHQIRKHFAHIRHPIIGDKRHGDVKHNTYFKNNFSISRMLLHAHSIQFAHPESGAQLSITSQPDLEFQSACQICHLDLHLS